MSRPADTMIDVRDHVSHESELALAGLGHALAPERADWAEQLDRLNRFKIGDDNRL